ncbi:Hypothetical predicted protein [Olea europaea subsp. europaea]|uniref:Uncharacterized protein n=1 Tax=Olea europaea subsp. europaea TaxID=158383 RepID=A0A8S0PUV2_OLEEU|nr:Hypothetical predicted protein [Olea europaea subsp. europaea]
MESMSGSSSGRQDLSSPFGFHDSSISYFNSSPVESQGNPSMCSENFHQRCSSESFLMEEQPSWLDDLLNESESPVLRGHQRSASDTNAYLGQAEANKVLSTSAEEKNREESTPQNLEGSTEKANGSQAKPSAPKIDANRAKQ